MSTLSQADYLRRKLEDAKCCNPPVFKVGTRDSSETTQIRKLKAIGQSSVPAPRGRDASFTTGKNAGCPIDATMQCTTTQMIPAPLPVVVPFSPLLFDGLAI